MAACDGEAPAPTEPAALAPADAPLYVEGSIRPADEDAAAIEALSNSLAGIEDPGARIVAELNQSMAEDDPSLTYEDDIEPWLGERAAFFVSSSAVEELTEGDDLERFGVSIQTTDTAAARRFIDDVAAADPEIEEEERSYEGVDYLYGPTEDDPDQFLAVGIVGDFLVLGDEGSFKEAVDAASGDSLADSDQFEEDVSSLPGDGLATAYADIDAVLQASVETGETSEQEATIARELFGDLISEPLVVGLEATPDAAVLDVSLGAGAGIAGEATDLIDRLPADAWFAYGLANLGDTLGEGLSRIEELGSELGDASFDPGAISAELERRAGIDLENDLLAWMSDAAFYFRGNAESTAEFGALVETTDPDASAAAIEALRGAVESGSGARLEPPLNGKGFAFTSDDTFVSLGQAGDLVELSLSMSRGAAAGDPEGAFGDGAAIERARSALGEGVEPTTYLEFAPLFQFAASTGDPVEADDPIERRILEGLGYLAAGTQAEGDRTLSRVVIGVED